MADAVLDTTMLIDHGRGSPEMARFMASRRAGQRYRVHAVTAAEFLAGCRDRAELRQADLLLRTFAVVFPTTPDFRHALLLVRSHKLRDGVGWPDCLIAATCVRLRLPVVTLNERHFG